MKLNALLVLCVYAILMYATEAEAKNAQCIYSDTECACSRTTTQGVCLRYSSGPTDNAQCSTQLCKKGGFVCDCDGEDLCRIKNCNGWQLADPNSTISPVGTQGLKCIHSSDSRCLTKIGLVTTTAPVSTAAPVTTAASTTTAGTLVTKYPPATKSPTTTTGPVTTAATSSTTTSLPTTRPPTTTNPTTTTSPPASTSTATDTSFPTTTNPPATTSPPATTAASPTTTSTPITTAAPSTTNDPKTTATQTTTAYPTTPAPVGTTTITTVASTSPPLTTTQAPATTATTAITTEAATTTNSGPMSSIRFRCDYTAHLYVQGTWVAEAKGWRVVSEWIGDLSKGDTVAILGLNGEVLAGCEVDITWYDTDNTAVRILSTFNKNAWRASCNNPRTAVTTVDDDQCTWNNAVLGQCDGAQDMSETDCIWAAGCTSPFAEIAIKTVLGNDNANCETKEV